MARQRFQRDAAEESSVATLEAPTAELCVADAPIDPEATPVKLPPKTKLELRAEKAAKQQRAADHTGPVTVHLVKGWPTKGGLLKASRDEPKVIGTITLAEGVTLGTIEKAIYGKACRFVPSE